jgi:hypothetical protein
MSLAVAFLAHTVPVAGFYVAAEDRADIRELFILGYVGAAGLLLSAIAHLSGVLAPPALAF